MSTKKRLFIIAMIHFGVSLFYLGLLAVLSKSKNVDVIYVRTYTYSLIFPLYCAVMGVVTRLLSCKISVLLATLAMNAAQLILSLYKYRIVYKLDYGIANLELSYVLVSYAFLIVPYLIVSMIIYAVRRSKNIGTVKRIAQREHFQKYVEDPKFVRVYNKRRNRYEKYLVWKNTNDQYVASSAIIYYDSLERIMVDEDRNVYIFQSDPEKIPFKEYVNSAKGL